MVTDCNICWYLVLVFITNLSIFDYITVCRWLIFDNIDDHLLSSFFNKELVFRLKNLQSILIYLSFLKLFYWHILNLIFLLLFLLIAHLRDFFNFNLSLLPDVISESWNSLMLNLCLRNIRTPIELIWKENINFINQKNLWSLLSSQINLRFVCQKFLL